MKITYKQIFYFLICATFMFLPRRWFILGIQSYRLLLLILLAVTIKKWKFSRTFFNMCTVLYTAYIALYYLIDAGVMSAVGFAIDTVGLFILLYSNIRTNDDLQSLLNIFSNSLVIYSLLCILQTFTGFNIFDLVSGTSLSAAANYYRFGLVRSYGSFNTSINNALFMVMASCIILYLYEHATEQIEKRHYIIKYIICIAAICACMSRAPILVLILIWFIYLMKKGLLRFVYRNFFKIITVAAAVLVLFVSSSTVKTVSTNFVNMFVAIFNDSAGSSISSSFGVNVGGIGERLILYTWVGEKIDGNEITGMGPSSDPEFKYTDEWNKERVKTSLENHYLKILYNFGYIGLALFVLFTFKMLICTFKGVKKSPGQGISFHYIALMAQIAYIICIFTVASVDDMRMYYFIVCISILMQTKIKGYNC